MVKVFRDSAHPPKEIPFLSPDLSPTQIRTVLPVFIPLYNEPDIELRRTIEALQHQRGLAERGVLMHAYVVVDGWYKTHESMRKYILTLFPEFREYEHLLPTTEEQVKARVKETYVLEYVEKRPDKDQSFLHTIKGESHPFQITVIIKGDNRKKHNSHEWFFTFARKYHEKLRDEEHEFFAFCTDAGTSFAPDCLDNLFRHLLSDQEIAAVTGRQRVMERGMQGDDEESLLWVNHMLRRVQCFDYEASLACFMGAFSIAGFLPVIPGPCGLFRMRHLLESGIEMPDQRLHFETIRATESHPLEDRSRINQHVSLDVEEKLENMCALDYYISKVNVDLSQDIGLIAGKKKKTKSASFFFTF